MRIPTVHLNGTNGSDLMGQVTFASLAVDDSIKKVQEAWPNARDYYVQGDDAWRESLREWNKRLEKLIEVKSELDQVADGIGAQLAQRGEVPW